MKRLSIRLPGILTLFVLTLPAAVSAAPREVILYPALATVTEAVRLALQPAGGGTFKAVTTLPQQVLQDTLTASVAADSPLRLDDLRWRQIDRPDEARLADLRRQLQTVRNERIAIFSGIQSLDAQIQFWQAQAKGKAKGVEDANATAALLTRSIKKALQEKLTLEPDLEKADRRIRELQDEMVRISGAKQTQWEVTLTLSGPVAREVGLTLRYSLSGCGWSPLYRLDARPREERISFTWEAEIWQSTGSDWNQAEISLATIPPRTAIQPPEIPPWIIRPRPAPAPRARVTMEKADTMLAVAPPAEAHQAEPAESRQATYSLWNLGKRSLAAGPRQRIRISEESWPASFAHLIRPAQSAEAFVQARVHFSESRDIPPGQASFLIDGAILGKRSFSLAGREAMLPFGVDPLVTCEATLLSRLAGEKGFITDRQTQEWSWRYRIRNSRESTVRVRLEDAYPQVRDERIRVTAKSEPEPNEKNPQTLTWLFDLPPGGNQSILHALRLEAPREMELDLGWRR